MKTLHIHRYYECAYGTWPAISLRLITHPAQTPKCISPKSSSVYQKQTKNHDAWLSACPSARPQSAGCSYFFLTLSMTFSFQTPSGSLIKDSSPRISSLQSATPTCKYLRAQHRIQFICESWKEFSSRAEENDLGFLRGGCPGPNLWLIFFLASFSKLRHVYRLLTSLSPQLWRRKH